MKDRSEYQGSQSWNRIMKSDVSGWFDTANDAQHRPLENQSAVVGVRNSGNFLCFFTQPGLKCLLEYGRRGTGDSSPTKRLQH